MLETGQELLPTGRTRLISHHAQEVMLHQAVPPLAGIIPVLLGLILMLTVLVGVRARTVVVGLHVDLVTGSGGRGNISQDRPIHVLSVNFLVSPTILQSYKPGLIFQTTMIYLSKHLVRKFQNPFCSSLTLPWTIIYYRTSSLLVTRHQRPSRNILSLLLWVVEI